MPTGVYERTEEHRRIISKASKLMWNDPEFKKRMSKSRIGRKQSLETRKKLSNFHKGKKLSEGHKKKIGEGNRGKLISIETRKKISEAFKGRVSPNKNNKYSLETRKRMSDSRRGKNNHFYGKGHTKESRMKISQSRRGKKYPKTSRKMKELWKNIEYRKHMSEVHSGEKSVLWKGGISFEPYGIEFNKKLREQIRKRDNYTCQGMNCYAVQNGKKFPVHHCDYDKKNNKSINLITLCHSCHGKTNLNREYWESYFKGEELCQLTLSI